MNISVNKSVAMEYLEKWRERHIEEYKEQFKGWQEAMGKFSETLKAWSEGPADAKRPEEPYHPTNHLKQYNSMLQKLEFHTLTTIELSEREFDQIINDDWHWSMHWLTNNAVYGTGISERRKAPIYTLGSPDAAAFNRGKRSGEGQEYPSDHVEI